MEMNESAQMHAPSFEAVSNVKTFLHESAARPIRLLFHIFF